MTNDIPDWSRTTLQLDQTLAGSPIAYSSGTTTVTVPVPTGVHIVQVVLPTPGNVSFLKVSGHTTSAGYLTVDPQISSYTSTYYAVIPYLVDASVDIQIIASGSGHAYLSGITAPLAVADLVQNPAPWQAPNQPAKNISFGNPGSGNTATILAAPSGGQQIWLHTLSYRWNGTDANMFGQWEDSGGIVVMSDTAQKDTDLRYQDFKGAKLSVNSPLTFLQTGSTAAGTVFVQGSITYSVY